MTISTIRSKLASAFKNEVVICLAAAVAYQLITTLMGYVFDHNINPNAGLLDHMTKWDGGWYTTITHDWYLTNRASAAFYPLYPLTVWIVSLFGLISTAFAALIVNTISLWAVLIGLLKITQYLIGGKYAYLSVIFILISPAAFFMHVFYTEAFFLAIGLLAYLAALHKRWIIMGVLLAFITAARLPGILFVVLCFLEFFRAYNWKLKNVFNKHLLAFFLAPLGFVAYGTYLYFVHKDWLGMFHAYNYTSDWPYQHFNPNIIETIARAAYQVCRAAIGLRPFNNDIFVNHLLSLLALGAIAISSIYFLFFIKKKFIPIGIFGLLAIIMFTLNNNLVSVHRYTLPMFGIYLCITLLWVRYQKLRYAIAIGGFSCLLLQIFLLKQFTEMFFAG